MADADKIERAVKRLRMHEDGVKAAKAELALLLGLGRASGIKTSVEPNGAGQPAPTRSAARKGLGEKGAAILHAIAAHGGKAHMRDIMQSVAGNPMPGEAEAKRIRSSLHHLKRNGYVEPVSRGVWATTGPGAESTGERKAS